MRKQGSDIECWDIKTTTNFRHIVYSGSWI